MQVIHCLTGLQIAQGLSSGSLCQLGTLHGHIIFAHRFLGFFKALIAGFAHIGGTQHAQYAVAHIQYFRIVAALDHLGAEHGFLHGLRQLVGGSFGLAEPFFMFLQRQLHFLCHFLQAVRVVEGQLCQLFTCIT